MRMPHFCRWIAFQGGDKETIVIYKSNTTSPIDQDVPVLEIAMSTASSLQSRNYTPPLCCKLL